MNYIKDIELTTDLFYNMIIEIPKGTNEKFELVEPENDRVECVRKVIGRYPFYYGCFPRTLAGDNDPLDAILLTTRKDLKSLDVVRVIPVTVIKTIDNGEIDDKVICILADEKYSSKIQKLIKVAIKFLHLYKGKNSNTIIDKTIYDYKETIRIINQANKQYLNKNQDTNKLSSF